MEKAIVKVEHLSHRYTTQWAIRDISFEIKHKGVVGLLGSNGAGKSTMMNIICGVLKQSDGEVWIDGIDLREDPISAKRCIGFLPQKPPLYPDFTVEEYLTYCAGIRMMERRTIAEAVRVASERCGVSHFKDRLLKNLSGGYQQRVGIAQAIVHNPKFVVLDEPTNGLDPNQILEVRSLIKQIAQDRLILLSTHILSEVEAMCDDIMMLEEGEMIFSGSLEMFDNYIEPSSILISLTERPPAKELLSIAGVRSAEELDGMRYRLRFDGETDTLRRIGEECVRREWGLIELQLERSSMDAVFAKLSNTKPNVQ